MKEFQGKVAVITGGASGLGRAMADRFAREGMHIVLADVEPDALARAEGAMWGVIHGVRVFTPIMLKQGSEGHIVNTASVAGLISPPGMGIYCVSKHAVVTLSECLHHDLAQKTDKLKCSVLCPAYVPTGIADSGRNRPAALRETRHKSAA